METIWKAWRLSGLFLRFEVGVLLFFFLVVLAMFAVLVDQAEFELVEVLRAKLEFAGVVFAAFHFAVNCGCGFGFFTLFLVAHLTLSPGRLRLGGYPRHTKLVGNRALFFSEIIGNYKKRVFIGIYTAFLCPLHQRKTV